MSSTANRKKVLVVETNDAMAEEFQARLKEAGFDARVTWSGHEALALLRATEFDILLMDSYLADLHATDFLVRLNRLPLQPWVVVMMGDAETAPLRRYRGLGASTIVSKRDPEQVMKAISSCRKKEPLVTVTAD